MEHGHRLGRRLVPDGPGRAVVARIAGRRVRRGGRRHQPAHARRPPALLPRDAGHHADHPRRGRARARRGAATRSRSTPGSDPVTILGLMLPKDAGRPAAAGRPSTDHAPDRRARRSGPRISSRTRRAPTARVDIQAVIDASDWDGNSVIDEPARGRAEPHRSSGPGGPRDRSRARRLAGTYAPHREHAHGPHPALRDRPHGHHGGRAVRVHRAHLRRLLRAARAARGVRRGRPRRSAGRRRPAWPAPARRHPDLRRSSRSCSTRSSAGSSRRSPARSTTSSPGWVGGIEIQVESTTPAAPGGGYPAYALPGVSRASRLPGAAAIPRASRSTRRPASPAARRRPLASRRAGARPSGPT